jgi:HAD superfamily hydrolase (TIGR01662 family)
VAVKAVWFDVGETLLDESRYWNDVAGLLEVSPHVLWSALGATIARGEEHGELYGYLGIETIPAQVDLVLYAADDFYPDALPCLAELRRRGYFVGVAGNQSSELEEWFRSQGVEVDEITSSARLGVRKPGPGFFARLVELARCAAGDVAYVGDRVDNDVGPARAAGLVAVHVRRGPWGHLQDPASAHIRLDSLAELPDALAAYA